MGLFGKPNFKSVIKSFAEALEWDTDEIDDEEAHFLFEDEEGNEQEIFAFVMEDKVQFIIPSVAAFENDDDIPHEVSTELLQRNADLELGSWILEQMDDEAVYALMWVETLENLDAMPNEKFQEIINEFFSECADFDSEWETEE